MECKECKIEMKEVNFKTSGPLVKPYITLKEKGIFKNEIAGDVLCYLCTSCGSISFLAKNPEKFRQSK